jgi:uncharacterized membrane protein
VRPRNLVLALGVILLVVGVVLLTVPRTVQATDFRDNDPRFDPTTFSCGVPLAYAVGATGYDDSRRSAYVDGRFLELPEACDRRLRSNLTAGALWTVVGIALVVLAFVASRWYERWEDRREAAWRESGIETHRSMVRRRR